MTKNPFLSKEKYEIQKEIIDHMRKMIDDIEDTCFKKFTEDSNGEGNEENTKACDGDVSDDDGCC